MPVSRVTARVNAVSGFVTFSSQASGQHRSISRAMPTSTGTLRSAREMPAGPTVSPMGNGTPKRTEVSRSHAMLSSPPVEMHTTTKSAPVSASERSVVARTDMPAPASRRYVLGVRTRALETSGVDVFQDELGARGPGRDHKVVDQDRHPLRAPAADDRDLHDDYPNGSAGNANTSPRPVRASD